MQTYAPKKVVRDRRAAHDALLDSGGRPLDSSVRAEMEAKFAHDFSRVRVHSGAEAAQAAEALNARAFSFDDTIVFGAGEYRPHVPAGRYILAHELRHIAQGRSGSLPAVGRPGTPAELDAHSAADAVLRNGRVPTVPSGIRRAGIDRIGRDEDPIHRGVIDEYRYEHDIPFSGRDPATGEQAGPSESQIKYGAPARLDYVFVMGEDQPHTNNPFYTLALRYFRAHTPSAIFVTNLRTLADVLGYVGRLHDPAGTIYIVSHANADGTLSFGLNASDADAHTTATELREAVHPSSGTASALPAVHGNIDAQTTISIKGCNIGQSQEMVELVDEAFGGAGTVVAPKYEQAFGTRPSAGAAERERVDAQIGSSDPRTASTLLNYENRLVERATTTEGLSGPHIERPGTQLFTAGEIQAYTDTTLSDLPAAERSSIAGQLFHTQAVEAITQYTDRELIPTDRRAGAVFGQTHRLISHTRTGTPPLHTYTFDDGNGGTVWQTVQEPNPTTLIAQARALSSRPDAFAWSVEQHRNGDNIDFKVVGRRVVALLHHRTLTKAGGQPYDPSTADSRFFAHSTFQPPPPQSSSASH